MTLASLLPILAVAGGLLVLLLGVAGLFKAFYRKVDQGVALIVNDMSSTPKVHFTGALIIPVLYRAELMRISLITLQIDRRGKEGLICRDNMRADIAVAFYLRVNETQADVLRVAKAIGADRASDKHAVDELFNAKFSEALKTVGKKFDFTELFEKRQEFRDEIIAVIGNDLNGYVLEDVAIDYLEQTPKSLLDQFNILDAQGIRKITELTAAQNVVTNELEQNEKLAITKKNVEAREALLALERQQAEAEARQKREIETIRAREEAETAKVQEEQRHRECPHRSTAADRDPRPEPPARSGSGRAEPPACRGHRGRARGARTPAGAGHHRPRSAAAGRGARQGGRAGQDGRGQHHPRTHLHRQDRGAGRRAHQGSARGFRGRPPEAGADPGTKPRRRKRWCAR